MAPLYLFLLSLLAPFVSGQITISNNGTINLNGLTLATIPVTAGTIPYTPVVGACPSGFKLVRSAGAIGRQSLSSEESAYVSSRKSSVIPKSWKAYLGNVEAQARKNHVTLPSYVSSILSGSESKAPQLGIATSGGGYRAAIFGAAVLNALDGRNSSSAKAGIGGLLESATYLSGLSGGSWLLTSLVQANFPGIYTLVFRPNPEPTGASSGWGGWLADMSLITPDGANLVEDAAYIEAILGDIVGKELAGFPITFIDVWSRALARHFVNGTNAGDIWSPLVPHGAGKLWSGVTSVYVFASICTVN
jgi:lysophospholipase